MLDNPNWAEPPDGGWIVPSNWFSTINDPIRTILIVKYLDGVPFAVVELRQLAEKAGIGVREDYEAREEGYYACHLYFTLRGEVPDLRVGIRQILYSFELQVTTQLQEAIRPVTHPLYVARRSRIGTLLGAWQWQFDSDEFRGNYLAHTLHHIEGLIVDVRKRVRKGDAPP